MTRLALPIALAIAPLMSACATTAPDVPAEPERRLPGECDATPVQSLIGSRATGEVGARLLAETGAKTLRWVPPRTAVTMDFRPDRLTVRYDDNYTITSIACG